MQSDSLASHYDRISRLYDALDWPFEYFRYRKLRPILCSDLSGKVPDAGVGTGRNLAYYPEPTQVTGIDVSREQLSRARHRAAEAACQTRLMRMDVLHMKFSDCQFDACVATFLFCVLPDELQLPALREILRVVRRGGIVRLLEYKYSRGPRRRLLMKAMAPYVQAVFHARFDRPTEQAIQSSEAEIVEERFLYEDTLKLFELRRR